MNNLQDFTFGTTGVTTSGTFNRTTGATPVAQVEDKQFAVPAGICILDGKSGAMYAHLSTTPDVPNKYDGANRLFAQVTPYNVYAKLGHFKSTVWVTDLATGKPRIECQGHGL